MSVSVYYKLKGMAGVIKGPDICWRAVTKYGVENTNAGFVPLERLGVWFEDANKRALYLAIFKEVTGPSPLFKDFPGFTTGSCKTQPVLWFNPLGCDVSLIKIWLQWLRVCQDVMYRRDEYKQWAPNITTVEAFVLTSVGYSRSLVHADDDMWQGGIDADMLNYHRWAYGLCGEEGELATVPDDYDGTVSLAEYCSAISKCEFYSRSPVVSVVPKVSFETWHAVNRTEMLKREVAMCTYLLTAPEMSQEIHDAAFVRIIENGEGV